MSHAIGRLQCRIAVANASGAAGRTGQRLESIARHRLPTALDAALARSTAGRDGLYLFRTLRHRWRTRLEPGLADAGFADRWAASLNEALIGCLDAGIDETQLVRFENEAQYRAAFLSHLLEDPAAMPWWFEACRRECGPAGPAESAARILRSDDAPTLDILVCLASDRALERVLALLDGNALQRLWRDCFGESPPIRSIRPATPATTRDGRSAGVLEAPRSAGGKAAALRVPFAAALALLAETARTRQPAPATAREKAPHTPSLAVGQPTPRDTAATEAAGRTMPPPDTIGPGAANRDGEAIDRPGRAGESEALDPGNPAAHRPSQSDGTPAVAPHSGRNGYPPKQDAADPTDTAGNDKTTDDMPAATARMDADDDRSIGPLAEPGDLQEGPVREPDHPADPTSDLPPDRDAAFARFLDEWRGVIDWRDRASLTDAVAAALLFLQRIGQVETIDLSGEAIETLVQRGFDWLDLDRLATALASSVFPLSPPKVNPAGRADTAMPPDHAQRGPAPDSPPPVDLPVPTALPDNIAPVGSPPDEIAPPVRPVAATPRQRALLDLLADTVRRLPVPEAPDEKALLRLALRLAAETVARRPDLRDDAVLPALIAACLEHWQASSVPPFALRPDRAQLKPGPVPSQPAGEPRTTQRHDGAPGNDPRNGPGEAAPAGDDGSLESALDRVAGALETARHAAGRARAAQPATETWRESANAGLFLLIRGMLDLRLHALGAEWRREGGAAADLLLATILLRLSRPARDGADDPALALIAGKKSWPEREVLRTAWSDLAGPAADALDAALLRRAGGLGLIDPDRPVFWRAARKPAGPSGWFAGPTAPGFALSWTPKRDRLTRHWHRAFDVRAEPEVRTGRARDPLIAAQRQLEERLAHGALGLPAADRLTATAAALVVAAWGRWLRGFAAASPAFLLERVLQRPGQVRRQGNRLDVRLAPRPMDVALELSGHLEPIESPPWLPGLTVSFTRNEREGR